MTSQTTLVDVHARHPSTAPVLAAYGLDLCGGGSRSVDFARAHGIDAWAVLEELQRAAAAGGRPESRSGESDAGR